MAKRMIKRILSLIVSIVFISGGMASIFSNAENEDYYVSAVVENFENSLTESDYYEGLCSDNYYYEQFSDNMEDLNLAEKVVVWCTNALLDKHLNKDAYVTYLTQLLVMMQSGLAEVTHFQAEQNKIDGLLKNATEVTLELLFDNNAAKELLIDVGDTMEDVVKIDDSIETGAAQTEALCFAVANYENKYFILESIKNSTDNQDLKDACDELMEVCAYECAYIADQCVRESFTLLGDTVKLTWDVVYKAYAQEINQGFVSWLRGKLASNTSETVLRKMAIAGKWVSGVGYAFLGFDIGAGIMNIFVGDRVEMFREEMALAEISDALTDSLIEYRNSAMFGTDEERYSEIQKFIIIANAMIYTHSRGEYCNMYSRKPKERDGAAKLYYENTLCPKMNRYSETVSGIMTDALNIGDIVERVNEALENVNSAHLSQTISIGLTADGHTFDLSTIVENDINLNNGVQYVNIKTNAMGMMGNNQTYEFYVQTKGNTSDIYMSFNGVWAKQTGIPVSELSKLGSGFEGFGGIQFYLKSMENVCIEETPDGESYVIYGEVGSQAMEAAMRNAGLTTFLDGVTSFLEQSDVNDIQSILKNLAPMKVTFIVEQETFLPSEMNLDMNDTMASINRNLKSVAAKYGENFTDGVTTSTSRIMFSRYNELSEVAIPDAARKGIEERIIPQ